MEIKRPLMIVLTTSGLDLNMIRKKRRSSSRYNQTTKKKAGTADMEAINA